MIVGVQIRFQLDIDRTGKKRNTELTILVLPVDTDLMNAQQDS
jgi:hypothetical protein